MATRLRSPNAATITSAPTTTASTVAAGGLRGAAWTTGGSRPDSGGNATTRFPHSPQNRSPSANSAPHRTHFRVRFILSQVPCRARPFFAAASAERWWSSDKADWNRLW